MPGPHTPSMKTYPMETESARKGTTHYI